MGAYTGPERASSDAWRALSERPVGPVLVPARVPANVLAGEQTVASCAFYDAVTALMLCVMRKWTQAGAYAGPERAGLGAALDTGNPDLGKSRAVSAVEAAKQGRAADMLKALRKQLMPTEVRDKTGIGEVPHAAELVSSGSRRVSREMRRLMVSCRDRMAACYAGTYEAATASGDT